MPAAKKASASTTGNSGNKNHSIISLLREREAYPARRARDEVGSHHLAIVPDCIGDDLVRLKGTKIKSVHVRVPR
jgi:hypothetical protein